MASPARIAVNGRMLDAQAESDDPPLPPPASPRGSHSSVVGMHNGASPKREEPVPKRLLQLAKEMQQELKVKDRVWRFKVYRDCFVGSQAAKWLVGREYARTKEQAVALGNLLVSAGLIRHVTRDHDFADKHLFYVFSTDMKGSLDTRKVVTRTAVATAHVLGKHQRRLETTVEDLRALVLEMDGQLDRQGARHIYALLLSLALAMVVFLGRETLVPAVAAWALCCALHAACLRRSQSPRASAFLAKEVVRQHRIDIDHAERHDGEAAGLGAEVQETESLLEEAVATTTSMEALNLAIRAELEEDRQSTSSVGSHNGSSLNLSSLLEAASGPPSAGGGGDGLPSPYRRGARPGPLGGSRTARRLRASLTTRVRLLDNTCVPPRSFVPNSVPFPFATEYFRGTCHIRTRDNSKPDPFFEGRKRCLEFHIQGVFLKKPPGKVWFGAEVAAPMQLNTLKRAMCSIMLRFVTAFGRGVHSSLGDGDAERPHMVFPVFSAMDHVILTPPGEAPPAIGADQLPPSNIPNVRRVKALPESFEVGSTYTMCFYTMYIDTELWEVINIPGLRKLGLHKFWGEMGLNLVMYCTSPDARKHSVRDRVTLANIELVHDSLPHFADADARLDLDP